MPSARPGRDRARIKARVGAERDRTRADRRNARLDSEDRDDQGMSG